MMTQKVDSLEMSPKRKVAILLGLSAVLSVGACTGSPERNYSVPESLCGLKVKKDSYESFFPPGGEVERKVLGSWGSSDGYSDEGCFYASDEKGSLRVTGDWKDGKSPAVSASPKDILKEYEASDPHEYAGDFDTWTWEAGALVAVDCEMERTEEISPERDRYILEIFTANYRLDGDQSELQKKFGRIGEVAMKEVLPKLPCKKG